MPKPKTGWEPEHRTHFDQIVLGYDRIRPDYPARLFADVLGYAGAEKGARALEIGAGTGKATRPFLDSGYAVTAAEIGANMADFLRDKYSAYPDFRVTVAPFEEAELEEGSYDLVYAANAFHWVKPDIGVPKTFRLLRPGGTFALFRYNIFTDYEEEMQAVYEEHFYSHYKTPYRGFPLKSHEELRQPDQIRRGFGISDMTAYGFGDIAMHFYDVEQRYSAEEYVAFQDTMSDHRQLPEANREALYAGIRQAIQRQGGYQKVSYVYQLYMGRKL